MHVDGAATRSCITTVDSIGESAITTIEAIGQAPQGTALQKAWLELEVVQCGYCNGEQFRLAPNGMVDQSRARDVRQQSRLGNQPCQANSAPWKSRLGVCLHWRIGYMRVCYPS